MDQESYAASGVVLDAHVIRRAREFERTCPPAGGRLPPDLDKLRQVAEERLRGMTGLDVVEAIINYRRITGVPFKL